MFFRIWASNRTHAKWSCWTLDKLGPEKFKEAVDEALLDKEINAHPHLVEAVLNPEKGANPVVADILLNKFDGEYYQDRRVQAEKIKIPIYHGADWTMIGLHTPGDLRACLAAPHFYSEGRCGRSSLTLSG